VPPAGAGWYVLPPAGLAAVKMKTHAIEANNIFFMRIPPAKRKASGSQGIRSKRQFAVYQQ
jgi:hypothetical protein